ncbi:MAG TPA: diacylglycerol kinase [Candidatus Bipolaricaulota bacterium]
MHSQPYRHGTFKDSVRCAWKGLRWAVGTQRTLRFQLAAGALALGLGFVAQLDPVRMAILCLVIALVLVMEMVNTALEALVDQLYPQFNAAAGRVKDVAAGAALVAALGAVAVGIWLFWGSWEGTWFQRAAAGGTLASLAALLYLGFPKRK